MAKRALGNVTQYLTDTQHGVLLVQQCGQVVCILRKYEVMHDVERAARPHIGASL
jgi:hypothetical protein